VEGVQEFLTNAPTKTRKDQEMGKLSTSLTHQVANNLNVIPSKIATQVEGTNGNNTSKVKLSFNFSGEKNDST
jgi:two-component sensor histidine kinase